MVETAKVDIRKLQQLNDRINQCLDALNQVRLSVHGLSHTSGASPTQLGQQFGQPFAQQFGQVGAQDPRLMAQGINPLTQAGIGGIGVGGFAQPYGGGLSHTGGFAPSPFAAWNPMLAQQGALASQAAINPFTPFAQLGGLSHSGGESFESYGKPTWADPVLQAKLAQTFPYAQFAVPPIVSLY